MKKKNKAFFSKLHSLIQDLQDLQTQYLASEEKNRINLYTRIIKKEPLVDELQRVLSKMEYQGYNLSNITEYGYLCDVTGEERNTNSQECALELFSMLTKPE